MGKQNYGEVAVNGTEIHEFHGKIRASNKSKQRSANVNKRSKNQTLLRDKEK